MISNTVVIGPSGVQFREYWVRNLKLDEHMPIAQGRFEISSMNTPRIV